MGKEKKLYQVFKKCTIIDDWDEHEPQFITLGYTHAISEKQAITNVKKQKNIKKRNRYSEDFNNGSAMRVYEFIAKEVEK